MAGVKGRSGGKRPGSGRKPGTPNKINADLKDMILGALHHADKDGGQAYLVKQSEANPVAFMALVGKVLPMTVQGNPDQPLTFTITTGVPRADDQDD